MRSWGSDARGACEGAELGIRGTVGSVKASPAPAVEAMVIAGLYGGHTACCTQGWINECLRQTVLIKG